MITVAQARADRARDRVIGKFHIAHFPVGTVFEVESCCNSFLPEDQRINEYENYGRTIHTVAGVVANGPNSWVIERAEKCKLGNWLDSINITWVRRIIKRGDGNLYGEEKELVERIRRERQEFLDNKFPNRSKDISFEPSFSKGTYRSWSIRTLVAHHMATVYGNRDNDHLYDIDLVTKIVCGILKPKFEDYFFGEATINKKRFARAMKQAMAKGKVSRKKRASDERKTEMERWEKEMAYDYDNGDL